MPVSNSTHVAPANSWLQKETPLLLVNLMIYLQEYYALITFNATREI
jgi:hypothetical protein